MILSPYHSFIFHFISSRSLPFPYLRHFPAPGLQARRRFRFAAVEAARAAPDARPLAGARHAYSPDGRRSQMGRHPWRRPLHGRTDRPWWDPDSGRVRAAVAGRHRGRALALPVRQCWCCAGGQADGLGARSAGPRGRLTACRN